MRLTRYSTLSPLWPELTHPILSFPQELMDRYLSRQKDDGSTTIDLNICLSNSNTQSTTSDSYSAILSPESVKEVQQLTQTYVAAVAKVFGKELPGDSQTN